MLTLGGAIDSEILYSEWNSRNFNSIWLEGLVDMQIFNAIIDWRFILSDKFAYSNCPSSKAQL